MADFDYEKFDYENLIAPCTVTCMKSHSHRTTHDHCHLTGRYRASAHSNCNLNYKDSHYIPVVFHNLSDYNAHFIIKEIAIAYEGQVELFSITKEKYISFTKNVKMLR